MMINTESLSQPEENSDFGGGFFVWFKNKILFSSKFQVTKIETIISLSIIATHFKMHKHIFIHISEELLFRFGYRIMIRSLL